jgi:hypothetical protein
MPERKFDGKCPDCGETFKQQIFEWISDDAGWFNVVFECSVAAWLVAHHAGAPRNKCNIVRLFIGENEVGYVLATRLNNQPRSTNPDDWNFSFDFSEQGVRVQNAEI